MASGTVAEVSAEASGVSLSGAATGACLDGSRKYSSESLEERSVEGLHANSN